MSRRLGSKLERAALPKPIAGEPTKPAHLSASASAEWDRILGELIASGLTLTPAHRGLVALAATLSADIKSCWAAIEANGSDYCHSAAGTPKLHPAVQRLDCLRRDLLKALTALGLQKPALENENTGERTLDDVLNAPDGPRSVPAKLDSHGHFIR
jgi:phage terminase small subunit